MSQHRQDIPTEPSRWWIVLYSLAGVIALWVVLATIAADPWTWVHLAAVVFGLFTAAVFAGLSGHKILQRGEARLARVKREHRESERARREHEERMRHTGTWRGDHVGQVLTVRYDPAGALFHVQGWLGDHFQVPSERPWNDRATMAQTIAELEVTGELEPADDEGTRAVRARLDLPGPWNAEMAWDAPEDRVAEDEVNTTWEEAAEAQRRVAALDGIREELGVEDTGVISYTDTGLPRRPVGESLRPIDVARFRD